MTKTTEPMDDDNRKDNRKGDVPRGGLAMLLMLIGVMLVAAIVWQSLAGAWSAERVDYSIFLEQLDAGNIRRVELDGMHIQGAWVKVPEARKRADGKTTQEFREKFATTMPMIEDHSLEVKLGEKKVEFSSQINNPSSWIDLLGTLILVGFSVGLDRKSVV